MDLIHIFVIIGFVLVGTEMIAHAFKNMERGRKRNIVMLIGAVILALVFFFIYADTFLWD